MSRVTSSGGDESLTLVRAREVKRDWRVRAVGASAVAVGICTSLGRCVPVVGWHHTHRACVPQRKTTSMRTSSSRRHGLAMCSSLGCGTCCSNRRLLVAALRRRSPSILRPSTWALRSRCSVPRGTAERVLHPMKRMYVLRSAAVPRLNRRWTLTTACLAVAAGCMVANRQARHHRDCSSRVPQVQVQAVVQGHSRPPRSTATGWRGVLLRAHQRSLQCCTSCFHPVLRIRCRSWCRRRCCSR